ncbi:MAG TPA: 2-oxoacid:acceptor oxidoreductase family protein [bacterium]|jgi:pyruvate ferredoxin oxidoreductase gamma subunit|nr:2-oxoacid:acceptor oxidoreductase family protein [Dictyoglomota bacterium]HHV80301.1 pyruvate synthase [bacterium]HOL55371.1 2-oxoacid:acceptor oxidoreductase family protein [bacterium]HON71950.1 2-oxoacid:acceptor oxidoreductase family protein [bacterium]HOP55256.1 2-oxoacid:acceptor oxidoreductase family protein [bacterium]
MQQLIEIRWHARAGQGAKSAAYLLAESALGAGKYIQAFPEYGPERMGAPMKAYTRIGEAPIRIHSQITDPDVIVVLDPSLLKLSDTLEGWKDSSVLIINTNKSPKEIRESLNLKGGKVCTIDATRISMDTIGRNIPNTPLLGALIRVMGTPSLDGVLEELRRKFSGRFSEKVMQGNIEAVKRAYEEVQIE